MPPPRIQFAGPLRSAFSTSKAIPSPLISSSNPRLALNTTFDRLAQPTTGTLRRTFTTTPSCSNWLQPKRKITFKDPKGRPRMPTGGSVRGTTLVWGDYGLRMRDHDRRVSAAQLKNGEDVIRRRLRGNNYRLFMRVHAGTAVFTKGNESRMGTGKGSFDYWAARVPVSRIIFEVKADVHEQVIRDAMRLAANKMPGLYEFVKKGDPPVMGITKLGNGVTAADLKRPRKQINAPSGEHTAHRLPGTP